MAKIKPMELIQSMSGKVCGHSDTYFTVRYGQTYTATMCNKRATPYSETEIKQHIRFKAANAAAVKRMQDPTHMAQDQKDFKAQKRYKSLRGYLVAKAFANTDDEGNTTWPN